mmetsp:Transcript_25391/g.32296  ORF Transcript_25391/g.32296 Transcript_25391/m.32296 type:complete len:246 (+) Transcript_25391:2009-2746(+)
MVVQHCSKIFNWNKANGNLVKPKFLSVTQKLFSTWKNFLKDMILTVLLKSNVPGRNGRQENTLLSKKLLLLINFVERRKDNKVLSLGNLMLITFAMRIIIHFKNKSPKENTCCLLTRLLNSTVVVSQREEISLSLIKLVTLLCERRSKEKLSTNLLAVLLLLPLVLLVSVLVVITTLLSTVQVNMTIFSKTTRRPKSSPFSAKLSRTQLEENFRSILPIIFNTKSRRRIPELLTSQRMKELLMLL